MKQRTLLIGLLFLIASCSQPGPDTELKPLLLGQLKNTHTEQNWFVPTKKALDGLTAEQSNWKDSTENHSIAELISHLVYWNEMNLKAFNGKDMSNFKVDNETTFEAYTDKEWTNLVQRLDSIQTEWEGSTAKATEEQLIAWSSQIANMAAHSAYHTGQIIYIRKQNGWWANQ